MARSFERDSEKIPIAVVDDHHGDFAIIIQKLLEHPMLSLEKVFSTKQKLDLLSDDYPRLLGKTELKFSAPEFTKSAPHLKLIFLLTNSPDKQDIIKRFRDQGVYVFDFLPQDIDQSSLTLGIPEIYNEDFLRSGIVSLPSARVTISILALAPFLQNQMLADAITRIDFTANKPNTNYLSDLATCESVLQDLAGRKVKLSWNEITTAHFPGIKMHMETGPIRKWDFEHIQKTIKRFYKRSPHIQVLSENQELRFENIEWESSIHFQVKYDDLNEKLVLQSWLDPRFHGGIGQIIRCLEKIYDITQG